MVFLEPLVTTVGVDMGVLWQRRSPAADFEIMNATGHRLGNADDAALLRDGDFSFDGVSLSCCQNTNTAACGKVSLDWLLRAVDNQRFGFLAADPD